MTSIWVAEHGWCYLNAAIDCCTREITARGRGHLARSPRRPNTGGLKRQRQRGPGHTRSRFRAGCRSACRWASARCRSWSDACGLSRRYRWRSPPPR